MTLHVPQTTKVLAKPPHGDCVDVDEVMNRQINFYAHRFPYSYNLCHRSVMQALLIQCHDFCAGEYSVPCNPENITEIFGIKFSDFQCDDSVRLSITLTKKCPEQCTLHAYDVKHFTRHDK